MSILNKHFHLPGTKSLNNKLIRMSGPQRLFFYIFIILMIISTGSLLFKINDLYLVEIPTRGSTLSEGVIGAPKLINPLIATTSTDKDLVALIYSGLLRATPNGTLKVDLAKVYKISDDGKEYTVQLKDNLLWHDGEPLTADDILFTIAKTQDPNINSPERANWDGVIAEKVDSLTIKLTLEKPHAPFIQNLTLGILPKHLWEDVPAAHFILSPLNQKPIGSGPYKFDKVKIDSKKEIPKYYTLQANEDFILGEPYISKLKIHFYSNEELMLQALLNKEITNASSLSPATIKEIQTDLHMTQLSLPRVFGAFMNQNQASIFTNITVRKALDIAIDRDGIIDTILGGFATPINGPLPNGALGYVNIQKEDLTPHERIEKARTMLESEGWKYNEEEGMFMKGDDEYLKFTISTSDVDELINVANQLKKTWGQVGAEVTVKVFEKSTLEHSIIRPRKYDMLLFGEIIGRDSDPFAFWHSSQRNDPGLNIALYANIDVDKILEDARVETNTQERANAYVKFQEEIYKDMPAIFLYSPQLIYIMNEPIMGVNIGPIASPPERFLQINEWYFSTTKIWEIFNKD